MYTQNTLGLLTLCLQGICTLIFESKPVKDFLVRILIFRWRWSRIRRIITLKQQRRCQNCYS